MFDPMHGNMPGFKFVPSGFWTSTHNATSHSSVQQIDSLYLYHLPSHALSMRLQSGDFSALPGHGRDLPRDRPTALSIASLTFHNIFCHGIEGKFANSWVGAPRLGQH